jgi:hypothetical protein
MNANKRVCVVACRRNCFTSYQELYWYLTDKFLDHYDERLSATEPELWEIVDISKTGCDAYMLVPESDVHEGLKLLREYLVKHHHMQFETKNYGELIG